MMVNNTTEQFEKWLIARLTSDDWQWLQSRLELVREPEGMRDLHISLGLIPRKLGRSEICLDESELELVRRASNQFLTVSDWTIETVARLLLLCTLAHHNESNFGAIFRDLCRTADLTESITFYRGIALYPRSELLDAQIGEGLRSNIRIVFESIAHNNSYPCEYFDQNRWNHMVLKALFVESTLAPIYGLDERANLELAGMLCDYAHERWAAGRPVSYELWRCVGPYATGDMLEDLRKIVTSHDALEKNAGLLALSQCNDPEAASILKHHPAVTNAIVKDGLTWNSLSSWTNQQALDSSAHVVT